MVELPSHIGAALGGAGAAAWPSALAVRTSQGLETTPVAGTYTLDADGLHFHPLFAFVSGVQYVARFAWGDVALHLPFEVPSPPVIRPRVQAIHPAGAVLPENTLRLYVQFSRPMRARGVHAAVRLVDEAAGVVPLAFVEVADGLWSPDQTRLTLFFHPGRVKRGVAPGRQLGPPLRAGRAYRVVIEGTLTDASGVALGTPFEHRFRVGEADRVAPQVDRVGLAVPASPQAAVVVAFHEPVDVALAHRWIWIENQAGDPIAGQAVVGADESTWTFVPAVAWKPGRYLVRVRAALEDRAGNRFDRAFDRDAGFEAQRSDAVLALPFEVPPP